MKSNAVLTNVEEPFSTLLKILLNIRFGDKSMASGRFQCLSERNKAQRDSCLKKIRENECRGCQKKSDSTNVMIAPIRPL